MSGEEIKKYRLCVVIAGLLHDIGHCVLGHSYPKYVQDCGGEKPTEHETMGILIFQRLLKQEEIGRAFREKGLDEEASTTSSYQL